MSTQLSINNNEFLRQFESTIDGELVKIEYSQQERTTFLTKVVMSEGLREKGHLETFIAEVLEIIKEGNTKVMPTSPTIARFIKKNRRKYKELLPVGINI